MSNELVAPCAGEILHLHSVLLGHGVQGVVMQSDQMLHLIVGFNADQYAAEINGQLKG